jgi:uncharacterized membrane protein YuzA (DUF378 family)
MTDFSLATEWSLNPPFKGAEAFTRELAAKLKAEHNAELLYISMDTRSETHADHHRVIYGIHELIFKGSPIAPIVILGILAVIAIALIILAPVIWKLMGVTVREVIGYAIGAVIPIIAVVVFLVVGVPIIIDLFKGKKRRR